jgi:hypothetical protein
MILGMPIMVEAPSEIDIANACRTWPRPGPRSRHARRASCPVPAKILTLRGLSRDSSNAGFEDVRAGNEANTRKNLTGCPLIASNRR